MREEDLNIPYRSSGASENALPQKIDLIRNCVEYLLEQYPIPAHDYSHIERVYKTTKLLGLELGAIEAILDPATLLHDLGRLYENDTDGMSHAELSVPVARYLLFLSEYPAKYIEPILYAIRIHSRGSKPETLEAQILQDADKLDLYGAIGISRFFAWGGWNGKREFNRFDPIAKTSRVLDEDGYGLDHLLSNIPNIKKNLNTEPAKRIAEKREAHIRNFLNNLEKELDGEL